MNREQAFFHHDMGCLECKELNKHGGTWLLMYSVGSIHAYHQIRVDFQPGIPCVRRLDEHFLSRGVQAETFVCIEQWQS